MYHSAAIMYARILFCLLILELLASAVGEATPVITKPPVAKITVNQGETFTIDCQADGVPTPFIAWWVNGDTKTDGERVTVVSQGGLGIMTITEAQETDAGNYTCQAFNTIGCISDTPNTLVTVRPTPVITKPPVAEITVNKGETFTIHCEADGVPTPLIVWILNGGIITSGGRLTAGSQGGLGNLTITDAQETDTGNYNCQAVNTIGCISATHDTLVTVHPEETTPECDLTKLCSSDHDCPVGYECFIGLEGPRCCKP